MKIIALLLLCCLTDAIWADTDYKTWVSLSTLWGQGSLGVRMNTDNSKYYFANRFNYSFKDSKIYYNEFEILKDQNKYFYGIRSRYQSEDYEIAPFLTFRKYFESIIDYSLYNEIEWRESPAYADSYCRTQHGITIFANNVINNEIFVPFLGIVTFLNTKKIEIEKTRLYLGYKINIKNYTFCLYFIPWRSGIIENEWDDTKEIGAYAIYKY